MYIVYDYRVCISDQPMGSKNGGCTHDFFYYGSTNQWFLGNEIMNLLGTSHDPWRLVEDQASRETSWDMELEKKHHVKRKTWDYMGLSLRIPIASYCIAVIYV